MSRSIEVWLPWKVNKRCVAMGVCHTHPGFTGSCSEIKEFFDIAVCPSIVCHLDRSSMPMLKLVQRGIERIPEQAQV